MIKTLIKLMQYIRVYDLTSIYITIIILLTIIKIIKTKDKVFFNICKLNVCLCIQIIVNVNCVQL